MIDTFSTAISRHGKRVPLYKEEVANRNEFGNVETEWNQIDTVLTVRSYQNRNTTTADATGELNRDRTLFFFPKDSFPNADERIEYGDNYYEFDAITEQLTHVVAPAAIVRGGFNP